MMDEDDSPVDFYVKEMKHALEILPCWLTVLGQDTSMFVTNQGRYSTRLASREKLRCLLVYVYCILFGDILPFELSEDSLSLEIQRMRDKVLLMYKTDDANNMASLPCRMLLKWTDWTEPENLPDALITAYKYVWLALSQTSRKLCPRRQAVDLGLVRL